MVNFQSKRDIVPLNGSPRRYVSLQAGRGLAALLVVLHHVGFTVGCVPRLWHNRAVFRYMMGPRLGVAFFFVLSGMVILTAHWKDIDRPSSIRSYLWKRFRRIYPIYWLVLAFVICGQGISVNPQSDPLRNPFAIVSGISLVHIRSWEPNGLSVAWTLPVAWTLFHEVMFYAIFAVAILNKRLGSVLLILWLTASLLKIRWTNLSVSTDGFFSPLHLLFGMGMATAWFLRQRKILRPDIFCAFGSLVFAASIMYCGWKGEVHLPAYLTAGAGASLALLGAAAMEQSQAWNIPRWSGFLGEASYSIYLIHFPIVLILGHLCFWLDARLRWPLLFWMFLLLCVGTGAGCLLHIFVERPLLNWLASPRQQIAALSNSSESNVDVIC